MNQRLLKLLKGAVGTAVMMNFNIACSKHGSTAAAGLVMTGSSAAATVAQNVWQKLFLPSAIANPPPALMDQSGATVLINSAWVVIKEIEFKSTESAVAGESLETSLIGPYYVNLISPEATKLDDLAVPDHPIRRVKFKFHKIETAPPENVPSALSGHSIMIEGSVGGAPFTYLAEDSTEVQVGGPHGVIALPGSNLLIAVKVADLVRKINLSSISAATTISTTNRVSGANLCPGIDASAADLYTCFRKGLESEAKLGRDDDGDHEIEANEEEVDDAA